VSCEWDEGRVVGDLVLFSALRMLGHGYLIIFLGSRLTSDALVASRVPERSPSLASIHCDLRVFETQGEVRVLRILHGVQQWPPR
jgi:hypothetical protein